MRKLLKYDIIHPATWLEQQKQQNPAVRKMNLREYRDWLNGLRSNYSDFYTYWLNQAGGWEAEEYYLMDPEFTAKAAQQLWGRWGALAVRLWCWPWGRLGRRARNFENTTLAAYARRFGADVVFARSQPRPSAFWRRLVPGALTVARLSARLPRNWHPNDFDLIYTDQPDFKVFFELHGTPTIVNKQGFDERLLAEIRPNPNPAGVVFVGGLGTQNFLQRTEFLEQLAAAISLDWYGYWWQYGGDGRTLTDFPALSAAFRGSTSGLPMFQHYVDAAVCVNDYVDTANGIGYNQRMFEVMGIGGFLLTRQAPNFSKDFPEGIFATYRTLEECLEKIAYYQDHPEERAEIARRGQAFVLENFNYRDIARRFGRDLSEALEREADT